MRFVLSTGWTPLIIASKRGKLPVVRCLLEHKAEIEAKDNNGMYFRFLLLQFSLICVAIVYVLVDAE